MHVICTDYYFRRIDLEGRIITRHLVSSFHLPFVTTAGLDPIKKRIQRKNCLPFAKKGNRNVCDTDVLYSLDTLSCLLGSPRRKRTPSCEFLIDFQGRGKKRKNPLWCLLNSIERLQQVFFWKLFQQTCQRFPATPAPQRAPSLLLPLLLLLLQCDRQF